MWTYNQTQSSDEIYHYGVPGMKWGVRRATRLNRHEYDTYTKAAKAWLSAKNDIMNMNVSTVRAKDIKKRFKNARSFAGGAFVQ